MGAHEKLQECMAKVPFACPECDRGYHIHLDLMKLTRLKRVAICGTCQHRFSVSVHFRAVEVDEDAPSTPPPAVEATPAPKAARSEPPTTPPLGVTSTLPPEDNPPRRRPVSAPSPRSSSPGSSSLPPPASQGRRRRTQPQGLSFAGEAQFREGPTATSEATTRPYMKAVTAEEERAAGATVRTKPDTVADAVADADRHRRVKTSIIVEIGDTSGDSPKRSVYNASQLTKPGIGIPKHLLEKYRRKTKT